MVRRVAETQSRDYTWGVVCLTQCKSAKAVATEYGIAHDTVVYQVQSLRKLLRKHPISRAYWSRVQELS